MNIVEFKGKLRAYGGRMCLVALVLAAPLAWAAASVPLWVSVAIALLIPLVAIAIVLTVWSRPQRRATDTAGISTIQIEKMREASTGLNNLLGRWSTVSHTTRTSLEEVDQQVEDVIAETETAVIEITNSFVGITRKTRSQMVYALSLLQQTKNVEEGHTAQSQTLPQYIRASESMLNSMAGHLLHFSEASLELVQRQERVREQARRIDDLLDQMTGMSSEVSRLALNTSVMGRGSEQRDFIELTDKVRAMSQSTNDLTRNVRQSLEGIKKEIAEAYGAINSMAQDARTTAREAKIEVEQLSNGMTQKNNEVVEILDCINSMGEEIQQDINKVIVSMQFQDITRQKLQRLKDPVLAEVLKALNSIFTETRFLNLRLNTRLVETVGLMEVPGAPMAAPAAAAAPVTNPLSNGGASSFRVVDGGRNGAGIMDSFGAAGPAKLDAPAAGGTATPFRVVKNGAVVTVTTPTEKQPNSDHRVGVNEERVELF